MAMTVTTSVLPVGEVGVPYTVTLAETGGVAPITWTQPSGIIPTGLSLAGATGIVSGTPTVTESAAAVQFEATDSTTPTPQTATSTGLTWTIYAALAVSTTSLPNAMPHVAYSTTLATTGGNGAVTWAITAGVLPAGLILNPATGVIFGTPTAQATTATVTVKATDAMGGSASQSLTIIIPTEVVRNFNSSMAAFPGIPLVSVAGSSLPDVGTTANYKAQVQGGWENEKEPCNVTDRQLQKLYQRLNERFFGGQLPEDAIVRFANLDRDESDGNCDIPAQTICIDRKLQNRPRWTNVVLLHEMTHLALPGYIGYPTDDGHGMLQQAEIVRLFRAGAYDGLL